MRSRRPETIGAWLLLVASLTGTFGLVWDIQWHTDVGPDTFFTAPHLVVYLGMATTGLTSLAACSTEPSATRICHSGQSRSSAHSVPRCPS